MAFFAVHISLCEKARCLTKQLTLHPGFIQTLMPQVYY